MNATPRPVIVIVGQPDPTLTNGLRTIGLTPIAHENQVVIWGPPPPRQPARPTPTGDQAPTLDTPRLLMTIRDAALTLRLGRSTVYELIGRGELEVVHVGRSARIPTQAVEALVEQLRALRDALPKEHCENRPQEIQKETSDPPPTVRRSQYSDTVKETTYATTSR